MGLLSNRTQLMHDIEVAMAKIEEAPIAAFRKVVLQVLTRILYQTPQYSGRAVANWNVGINAPDLSVDQNMGDDLNQSKSGHTTPTRQKGDKKWIAESLERAKYVIRRIKRGDIVYITNSIRGDPHNRFGDAATSAYLAELQDHSTWFKRLRLVNQPYETAFESAMFVAEGLLARGDTGPISGLEGSHEP